jgi:hypothetical protein
VVWSSRKGKALPPGVKAAAVADQLAGGRSLAQTAEKYGIDVTVVKKLATNISSVDREEVSRIATGLPRLYSLIAAEFGLAALDQLRGGDPSGATKLVFGSKLAVEAGKIAGPAADAPGVQMLAFIQSLTVTAPAVPGGEPPRGELGQVVDMDHAPDAIAPSDAEPSTARIGLDPEPPGAVPAVEDEAGEADSRGRAAATAWLAARRTSNAVESDP